MHRIALLFALLTFTACTKHEPSEFDIEGLDRQAVIEKIGEPEREYQIDGKRLNDSMGPKPQLARLMADDETIEVWSYTVTDSRAAAVYFDDSGVVAEVIIFRTDVMY
ncbi:MAG: hypothetical protein WBN88_05915 [Anderseniella sp.]